mgnify:CR=1 FL=1
MKIIDFPLEYSVKNYELAIQAHVEELSKVQEVKSVYQIGGLSTPGISDIDLVVVFEDGFEYQTNPRLVNSGIANYLFTHGLYGTSHLYFSESLKFTFFHNFKLLYGEDLNLNNVISNSNQKLLKEQIALEFLFKMYVNLIVQKSYNTIKLRSIFLHIKALHYDFEFLNIQPKKVLKFVEEGIALRNNWFSGEVSKKDVKKWFKLFFTEYESFLKTLLIDFPLYTPSLEFKIAPNIEIVNAKTLSYSKEGIVFPDTFNILDKKYFKALNRINNFKIEVPIKTEAPEIIKDYFRYADIVSGYNKKHIPHFMSLTSSLKVYK